MDFVGQDSEGAGWGWRSMGSGSGSGSLGFGVWDRCCWLSLRRIGGGRGRAWGLWGLVRGSRGGGGGGGGGDCGFLKRGNRGILFFCRRKFGDRVFRSLLWC